MFMDRCEQKNTMRGVFHLPIRAGNLYEHPQGFYLSRHLKPTRKRRKGKFHEANRHQRTALVLSCSDRQSVFFLHPNAPLIITFSWSDSCYYTCFPSIPQWTVVFDLHIYTSYLTTLALLEYFISIYILHTTLYSDLSWSK